MENTITIETEHTHHTLKISVDNSTELKDLTIEKSCSGRLHHIHIKHSVEDGEEVVVINNIPLKGREVTLLKEFLNKCTIK